MSTRVITQLGATDPHRGLISEAHPEVELVDFSGEPPDGLQADVFFGGYMGWEQILRWLDATGVRWVQLSGTGVDKVPDAVYDGRIVTSARGAAAVPIAEWVIAAIMARAKRFPEVFVHEPPKYWNFPIPPLASVAGSTVGVVGLGGIGVAIAERAMALGMNVRAMRRTDTPSPIEGVELVTDIEALVADADHVVLAAPATARTKHLIDAAVFDQVKPGVHLVNIAAARWSIRTRCASRSTTDGWRWPPSTRSIPNRCRRATGSTRTRRCS